MNRILQGMAALVAAVAVLVVVSLPPARVILSRPPADDTVPGIIHVHTIRSDGRGNADDIAAAAGRAGLKFVVLTDHGDATRTPDPPTYRSGVLCLDAVEISTTGGHYLALDMPAAPYPLGGEARDVVDDVKRLGGFGIVAHPESPKPALRWRAWDAPFDAIEWVNPDTSWRVRVQQPGWRPRWRIVEALAAYPFRSPESIARFLAGTALSVDRWQALARAKKVVVLSGADAHANLPLGNADPADHGWSLPIPGYEASFRAMSVHVRPDLPLTGDARRDAVSIMRALRRGHAYTAIDGLASPAAFEFTATTANGAAREGDELAASGPVRLSVISNAPPSFTTSIWQGGRVIASVQNQPEFTRDVEGPAAYRVEIDAPSSDGPIPWVISNPIYVGMSYTDPTVSADPRPSETRPLFDGRTSSGWWTESDGESVVALDVAPDAPELRMRYGLANASTSGQYAMAGVNTPRDGPYTQLRFTARSERPLRLDVQLRVPGPHGDRWHRSVYIDRSDRRYTIEFDEMTPIGDTRSPRPALDEVRDVMLVVDSIHTRPGATGQVSVKSIALQR